MKDADIELFVRSYVLGLNESHSRQVLMGETKTETDEIKPETLVDRLGKIDSDGLELLAIDLTEQLKSFCRMTSEIRSEDDEYSNRILTAEREQQNKVTSVLNKISKKQTQ